MKIFTQVLFVFFSIALVSCGDDDDPSSMTNQEVGVWDLADIDYSGTTVTETPVGSITQDFVGMGRDYNATLTLNADGSYVSSGDYVIDLTTTTNGVDQESVFPVENFLGTGTYVIDGTKMTVSDTQGNMSEATISNLTDNVMDLRIITSTANPLVNSTTEVDVTYSFTK